MSTTTTTTGSAPAAKGLIHAATRVFNPLAMLFAGTRLMPLYGVLEHRGRRSGKVYRTPVVVRAVDDGFIVPMPWGLGTDWYRNVKAAGGCSIRWNGRDYTLVEPEVINDAASVAPAFSKSQLAAMRRFGIEYALHLRQRSQAA